ncbi:hypothetical protein TRFO_15916 [Tritrichomonas foetus]|uniref:Uncharacterized protein n=1 Tax=Tritrichomonas foetus TaxID=1144522 RepID=A0A1J4KVV7_9EUKA|nr:hypothetical protein TRFO_15916 [Tritrichomonas foetus]|eukprot:OHT13884.1 hypothetical protein TRFO_15916 [Tritrichomonas foetus]
MIAQNLIGKESLENEVKTYMDIFRDKRELDDFLFQISKDNIDINSATSIFYAYKASIMIEHTLYDAVSFAAKSEHYGRNSTNEDTKKAVSLVKNLFQSQTDEDQALIQQQLSQLYMKFVKIK